MATLAAYLVALVATVATIPVLARGVPLGSAWRTLNGGAVLVGIGIVAVEIGFLLAYRAGCRGLPQRLNFSNATVAVAVLGLGVLVFHEPLSLTRLSGVRALFGGSVGDRATVGRADDQLWPIADSRLADS